MPTFPADTFAEAHPRSDDGAPIFTFTPKAGHAPAGELARWISDRRPEVDALLQRHGALLFRGFGVEDALGFEAVAKALDPELRNDYLGTSPRAAITEFVHSASELPSQFPVPQHAEMSFVPRPPRKVFFHCQVPPRAHGETPVCDLRKVWAQLQPRVREEFLARGVRNIRNYHGPETKAGRDFWKLKRWDEMFGTTDRGVVEARCREQRFEASWDKGGRLRLVNTQDAARQHPATGETAWHNHVQVFHVAAAALEYEKIVKRQGGLRARGLALFTRALTALKGLRTAPEEQGMHCTFGDGGEIPLSTVRQVSDVFWRNMVFVPWRFGDVLAIDNFNTSHGRMPYTGLRNIQVAWTSG
jgi:hypothetical protein